MISLDPGAYVFCPLGPGTVLDVEPVASMVEDGGRTVVLPEAEARRLGLSPEARCAWITVPAGPLAPAVSVLAAHGIAVHVVSGVRRHHLFVPPDRASETVALLAGSSVVRVGEFEIDDDPGRIDRDVVWAGLCSEAYWARWRTRADVETQLDRAWRVVGAYRRADGEMVGFARAVSDGVSFGYLADVFVLPEAKGRGVGKALVTAMLAGPERIRWTLFTRDAHSLYSRFGFAPPDDTAMVRPGGPG